MNVLINKQTKKSKVVAVFCSSSKTHGAEEKKSRKGNSSEKGNERVGKGNSFGVNVAEEKGRVKSRRNQQKRKNVYKTIIGGYGY